MPAADRLVEARDVEFKFHSGFAVSQKQKSVRSLHAALKRQGVGLNPLEVSTKSEEHLGNSLSAFNLTVAHGVGRISLETAFQGSKVFGRSGQHPEWYELRARDAKRAARAISDSGDPVVAFRFAGQEWPTVPRTAFYDWLYLRSVLEAVETGSVVLDELAKYDAFTDIEFNPHPKAGGGKPGHSMNCQARSCALLLSLHRVAALDVVDTPDAFRDFLTTHDYPGRSAPQLPPADSRLFD